MQKGALKIGRVFGQFGPGGRRLVALTIVALLLALLSLQAPPPPLPLALLTGAATLLTLVILMVLQRYRRSRAQALRFEILSGFIQNDAIATFIVSADGEIRSANTAATVQFGGEPGQTLAGLLSKMLANPCGILFRLQSRAKSAGHAQEDIATRIGHMRLSVRDMGRGGYIWRVEPVPSRTASRGDESLHLPMIMVGRSGAILFMNAPARALIGSRVKSLDRLFTNLPVSSGQVCDITTENDSRSIMVAEVSAGAGRRALYLLPPPKDHPQVFDQGQRWQVLQDLPVPLIKVAPDGSVLSFNRMAVRLIGNSLTTEVHLGQLMEGLGQLITDWLKDTLAGRMVQKSEFLRLTRTDHEAFVQVTLNRVIEEGKPALIAVLNDATELKSLEAQFVQSQKMQAIGQLAGGVAHDFNNLLTAISGHCDLLLLRHDQGDPDYGDLVQINQNANRAAALVGQLLAFSRKQTLRPETVDLRDTLADLTHLLNRLVGEKITLTLNHDPVLQPIRADKRQLEQVLMNLVVNARDAMPGGGEIRIITECTALDEPLLRDRVAVPAGQYVTVQVSDDGTGIAPDKLPKVFEPFFTTKRTGEGTGLGLSTAYGIIKQTGGFIFVDSILGTGTDFILYFPMLDAGETARPRPVQPATRLPTKHADGVILLVEDEAPVRAFASRALRLRGYTVLEAESAEAALKTLEDEALTIDVFVTDVVMPGMDGPTWVREALKHRPGVRVVFVSGYAEDSFGEEQTKIPNSVFLPKPFSLTDLTETVHRQLH
ncbi:ATP-binding protein [Sulfitobacter aestuarii]|uniref:histidine kinase n=1 Tax=Sulfitobacter aestuarii TaxID=2161676 RepID=A0ABW5U1U9_9RHOB